MAKDQGLKAAYAKDRLSHNEISAFCAQISMILHAGIAIGEGIDIMIADMKNEAGKAILREIYDQMETGAQFYQALEKTGKFPKYVVDMVEVGEKTGKLDNVMESLVRYYDREEAVAKSIRSAVTYPLVMIVMMLLVILVLLVKVMPIFGEVFQGLGSEMTGFSMTLLRFGEMLGRYSFIILGVLVVLAVVILLFRASKAGRRFADRFKSSFFLTRKLYAKIASGRFASAMSMTLSSGLDMDQSLEMVYRLVDNEPVKEKIVQCQKMLSEGANFSAALVGAGLFTGVYARMVNVAFKTGSLDAVMSKLAARYEEEVDTQVAGMISILEPTLVAILSIIVGMILLSVMLPLMSIMSSIG